MLLVVDAGTLDTGRVASIARRLTIEL